MTRPALLNNVAHKDLRVITRYGERYGDNVGTVIAFATEFASLQREYPIFFRRDPTTNELQSVALLGFEKNENLFLEGDRWAASYVPGIVARGPFLIGFQEQNIDGELTSAPVIHVDLDHPRVSEQEGEPVFLPHGGNSPFLEHVISILRGIREGTEANKVMFSAFDALGLIEPVKLEIKLDEERTFNVVGLHTISRQRLQALDGQALERLNRAGFLEGAYLVLASLANVQRLMALKQRRTAAA